MKIILTQAELEQAVEAHVRSQISINPNQTISIEFAATRGSDGITATLDISSTVPASTVAAKKPAFRASAKPEAETPAPAPAQTKATPFRPTAVAQAAPPEEEDTEAPAETEEASTDTEQPFVLKDEEEEDPAPEAEAKPAPTRTSIFSKASAG